jgi:hypothetical protein
MTTVADDIWAILREVAQSQKEFQKEFKESRKEFKESRKEFKDSQKEFKAVQKEIHDMQKQNEREIKAVNVSIGRLSNRLGEFVEESVRPAAVRLFRERGIDVHEVHQNITAKRDGEALEIDLLVINDKDVVVIECKSNLSIDDVNEHLIRLEKIRRLMPRYKDNRISGAVAGMVIPGNVAAYAIRKGLYVIGQNGDHLALQNDAMFTARIW